MKKLVLVVVALTILIALGTTILSSMQNPYLYWNWKCYNGYVDAKNCSGCSSPSVGEDCTAYCNSVLQVVECDYLGCQYSFCDDEAW